MGDKMTTIFDDGYQLPQMPGHRVNERAAQVERVWQQQLVWADVIATSDNPQERAHAVFMSNRLTRLAAAIERGDCDPIPMCPCGRGGAIIWQGLCGQCLHEEAEADRLEARGNQREARGG
jgi:hypothetical protein